MKEIKTGDLVQLKSKGVPVEYDVLDKIYKVATVRRYELSEFVELRVSESTKVKTLSVPRRFLTKIQ